MKLESIPGFVGEVTDNHENPNKKNTFDKKKIDANSDQNHDPRENLSQMMSPFETVNEISKLNETEYPLIDEDSSIANFAEKVVNTSSSDSDELDSNKNKIEFSNVNNLDELFKNINFESFTALESNNKQDLNIPEFDLNAENNQLIKEFSPNQSNNNGLFTFRKPSHFMENAEAKNYKNELKENDHMRQKHDKNEHLLQEEIPTQDELRDYTSILETDSQETFYNANEKYNLKSKNEYGQVHVVTQKSIYKSQDVVRGIIYLEVFEELSFGSIFLKIFGCEWISYEQQSIELFKYHFNDKICLYDSFPDNIRKGHYEFMFSYKLPKSIPSTSKLYDEYKGKKICAQTTYFVQGELNYELESFHHKNVKHIVKFKVYNPPKFRNIFNSLLLYQYSKYCFWAKKGEFKLNIKCHKESFLTSDIIELFLDIDNSKGSRSLSVDLSILACYKFQGLNNLHILTCSMDLPQSGVTFIVKPGEVLKGDKNVAYKYKFPYKSFGCNSDGKIFKISYFVSCAVRPTGILGCLSTKSDIVAKNFPLAIRPTASKTHQKFVRPANWNPDTTSYVTMIPREVRKGQSNSGLMDDLIKKKKKNQIQKVFG